MTEGYLTKSVDPQPSFDRAGQVFVPGGMYQEYPEGDVGPGPAPVPVPRLQLYGVSRDGLRCRLYGWPTAVHQVQQVIATQDDGFYFAGLTGFGRLRR